MSANKYWFAAAFISSCTSLHAADFVMNFSSNPAHNATPVISCNLTGYSPCTSFYQADTEPTRFIYEEVVLAGVTYAHMVIGDPLTGFAQDTYIQGTISTIDLSNSANLLTDVNNPMNGAGQASAHPGKVTVYQVVSDAQISMQFLKDSLSTKPLISQNLVDTGITSNFSIDMRQLNYNDINTAATVNNTLTIEGQGLSPIYFDAASDTQSSNINAGRYIYIDGPGNFGSAGTYNYADGGFDLSTIDWCSYWDGTQNTFSVACK